MTDTPLSDFDKFGDRNNFAYMIENINQFTLSASFPPIAGWQDEELRAKLHDRLHDDVTQLLRTAEFFSESRLEQSKGVDYFNVEFRDDIYDFGVYCYNDRIVVRKSGVKLSTFHHWYHAAVPFFRQLFESMLSVMSKELSRSQSVIDVSYTFQFVAHNFLDIGRSIKNYHVLSKLITQIPGVTGEITTLGEETRDVSRLDYKVNLWDGSDGISRRRLTYSVEAPSNRSFSGLWFSFSFGSETYTNPTSGKREWADPALLLDEHGRVYDFMWKKGMGGFMRSLLSHLTFTTTATYIP